MSWGRLEDRLPLASSDGASNQSLEMLTGGTEAPPPAQPPQPTGMAGATNPGLQLLQNYLKWHARTGRGDPLQALIGQQRPQRGLGRAQFDPVSLLSQGGQPFQQITHGANAGQVAQAYDLGNGQRAHVYFDEHGKRSVQVFRA